MINIQKTATLDGIAGGTVDILPDYKSTQISISGRTSGIITVTAKSDGGEALEALQPALTIDLSIEYTAKITGFALEQLSFVPDSAGSDFTVKINQWPV